MDVYPPQQHRVDANQSTHDPRFQRRCVDLMFGQTRSAYLSNGFCLARLLISFWGTADHAWLLT
ncbi:MAG: hypothetical protein AAGA68_12505 [Pseudomonadota bacterium]